MDEWQKSLDYVRGSNIYVRGYLDLRAWSLRLRTKTEGKPLREGAFPFTRTMLFPPLHKKNTRAKAKGLCGLFGEAYRGAVLRISRLCLDVGAVRWVGKGAKGRI